MAEVKQENEGKNRLYYGDNLRVLRDYIADESVDLCYIDPPFNSNRDYNVIYAEKDVQEDRAQAVAFVDTWVWDDAARAGYREIMESGNFGVPTASYIKGLKQTLGDNHLLAYLVSIALRVYEIRRVLKPTGSFYLHCDPTASHYLKLLLDTIFLPRGGEFRNEIIWCYRGGGAPKDTYGHRHDVILFYTKSKERVFFADAVRVPYEAQGIGRDNDTMWGKHKGTDKIYKPHPLGKIPEDWWRIDVLNSNAKERLGYPTQKPERLLERVINGSSKPGDTVLDCYCGCGTTVATAHRLGRRWIGVDITYFSISLIEKRLKDTYGAEIGNQYKLFGIPKDFESAKALATRSDRVRKEFEKWAVLTYTHSRARVHEKRGADKGADGSIHILDGEEYKLVLFSVKSGEHTGVMDIRDFSSAIDTHNAAAGVFLTLYPPTKPMIEWAAKQGDYQNQHMAKPCLKLLIVTIEEMLNGARFTMPLPVDAHKKAKAAAVSEPIYLDL